MPTLILCVRFVFLICIFIYTETAYCQLNLNSALNASGYSHATLSPDGKHVAAICTSHVSNQIVLIDVDTDARKVILFSKRVQRGNLSYFKEPQKVVWVSNDLLAVDYGIFSESITLQGKKVAELGDSVIGKLYPDQPESPMILVYPDSESSDVALVNATNGDMTKLSLPSFGTPAHWTFDLHGQLRAITMFNSAFWKDVTTVSNWYKPSGDKPWVKLAEFKVTDNYWTPEFVPDIDNTLIVLSNVGRDTRAAFSYDTNKREIGQMLAGYPDQDILGLTGINLEKFKCVITNGMKPERYWFDPIWKNLQTAVDEALPNRINVMSGDIKGRVLVFSYSDVDPGRWMILDVSTMKMHTILEVAEKIDPDRMRPMEIISYPARDGLTIPAYLTKPEFTDGKQPTIVMIHGGPTVRDTWSWNRDVQMLASRGYVVFQPQFRGSNGFGLKFQEAGYQQWGKLMQDDITDGVEYLIKQGITDPKRICIYGASYGGYAALWGLVKTPDLYQCGISFAGVSDITDMLEESSDANDDKIARQIMRVRIGDIKISKESFDEVSPRKHADQIKVPLLLMHGTEDRRVPIAQSKKMMEELDANHKVYEWLPIEGTGHGLYHNGDVVQFYGAMFKFLDKYNPANPPKEVHPDRKVEVSIPASQSESTSR